MAIAKSFLLAVLATALAWLLAMLALRELNFKKDGTRKGTAKGCEKSTEQIAYHNTAIYRDFEFFFKVTLAILGGIALLATQTAQPKTAVVLLLVKAAGLLQIVAAAIFSLFVVIHQKSKIERWSTRYSWWEPLLWQECWIVAGMIAFAVAMQTAMLPALTAALSAP